MNNFELVLQGGQKTVVTDLVAKQIEKAYDDNVSLIKIGDLKFTRAMFRGLLPIKDEVRDNKDMWVNENREWNEICTRMSRKTVDEKIMIELGNRINPGLKLGRITLSDIQIAAMEANVRSFFELNPRYPRCPMRVWWAFVADQIAPVNVGTKRRANPTLYMAKWWQYIARNDEAVTEWLRYN